MTPVAIGETAAQKAYREKQISGLPGVCLRVGIAATLLVVAAFYLFHQWGARLPPIEWSLIVAAPAMAAMGEYLTASTVTLRFTDDALEACQQLGPLPARSRIRWRQVRRWHFRESALFGPNVLLILNLGWRRKVRLPVDAQLRERIDTLLRQFSAAASERRG